MAKKSYKPEKIEIYGKGNASHRFLPCKGCGVEYKKYIYCPTAHHGLCMECLEKMYKENGK
jgi:hypothetical protein